MRRAGPAEALGSRTGDRMTVELVALLVGGGLIILVVTALLIVLLARDPSVLRGLLTRRGRN